MAVSFSFKCDGQVGFIDAFGFVQFGGSGFQVSAARGSLRSAILEQVKDLNFAVCSCCGKLEILGAAVDGGWVPSYWSFEKEAEQDGPFCPSCVEGVGLVADEDGWHLPAE